MKRILIIITMCSCATSFAQDKLSMYGETVALNFNQYNFNLDTRYKLSDYVSLSNWSTITQGRTAQQGFDYMNSTTLINFGRKGIATTLSIGHMYMSVPQMEFDQHQFVVKLRFKIL